MNVTTTLTICALLLASSLAAARADTFTYVDESGEPVTVEAQLAGSGQGVHALELNDGQYKIVAQAAVRERVPSSGPEPIDSLALTEQLEQRFGKDRFRAYRQAPFVIGLVLTAPIDRTSETRVQGFLKRAARFFKNVESVFLKYARDVRFELSPLKHPLVILIFEADEDFEQYAVEATGGRGLSAGNIAGFYSALTNYLVLRLSECHTFETPLHEAVHQLMHNRGVLQRLAPIPVWFNEGIATAFEGDAQRIRSGPTNVSRRYARIIQQSRELDWDRIVSDDSAFRGDILAGEAYGHAWGLHWLLLTQYKIEYMNYVRKLSELTPLSERSQEERDTDFREAFGKSASELQSEYQQALAATLRRRRIPLKDPPRVGVALEQKDVAEIGVTGISFNGSVRVEGKLKNISPVRPMSFYVTVETDAGTYAAWHVPELNCNSTAVLERQICNRLMQNARGGISRTFNVRVRSALPQSDEGRRWAQGKFPVPVYGR